MQRRDFLNTMISVGLGSSLAPMVLVAPDEGGLASTVEAREPPDFGTLQIQLMLHDVFPPHNATNYEDHAGLMIEGIRLGIRREEDFRTVLERHRDHAVGLDQEMVKRILGWQGKRPEWLTDDIVARVRGGGVFLSLSGLARTALIQEFGDAYAMCDTRKLLREARSQSTTA